MPMTVMLEVSDAELDHFRTVLARARKRADGRGPREVAAAARATVARLESCRPSPFVATRLRKVNALVGMLEDPEWQLPGPERDRVLDGLAYVAEAHDLDAIMLELVLRDLRHELEGYEEFDEYRRHETARPAGAEAARPVSREDWLESKRQALHARIRQRRERDLAEHGGAFALITRF
jgi:hypothetical protein